MDLEKLRQNRNETNNFLRHIGAEITHIEEGSAVIELVPSDEVLNPSGAVHGGCLFTMADIAAGTAACAYGYHGVTVNSSFNYLSPAIVAGDPLTDPKKIIATSRELKRGKRVLFYEVDVTDQDGRLLCSGQFTIMPLDMRIEL